MNKFAPELSLFHMVFRFKIGDCESWRDFQKIHIAVPKFGELNTDETGFLQHFLHNFFRVVCSILAEILISRHICAFQHLGCILEQIQTVGVC